MGNILIGIKRFLKNKNTVTIIAVLASIAILYYAYDYRIQSDIQPITVPYATRTIGPRTEITSDMVSSKKVSKKMAQKNVILSRNNVIGRYVSNKAVIPKGSMFYESMVVNLEDLPSSLFEDIPQENTVIYLDAGIDETYGNSIFPGNAIDIYFKGVDTLKNTSDQKETIGKFITSIKVLAVVDSQGNNVFETADTPRSPRYLMFSVPDDIYILLQKAIRKGGYKLFPVPRNKTFSSEAAVTAIASPYIADIINDNTIPNSEVDGKKGGTK